MVTHFSRRSFLAGSAALLVTNLSWAKKESSLGLYWRLDDHGDEARETIGGAEDIIASRTGHAIWVGEGRDRALRLDGYSVWVSHTAGPPDAGMIPLSISAWVALEAYPVNEAAVLQLGDTQSGASLRIDKWGYPRLCAGIGGAVKECTSSQPVPRSQWVHMAGTISPDGEIALFLNGAICESSMSTLKAGQGEPGKSTVIGRASDCPVIANQFPTGVLNGLIKDVRVYPSQLTHTSLLQVAEETRPGREPDLQINGDWCGADPQRPRYHAMPPRAWTNEPHGLVYFKDEYHIFYQKNANGPYWGNINWGHMTSPNLHAWTEMPVALSPEHGVDAAGCWSGSVIVHEGKLAILYTGGDGHRASINLATSSDGIHFIKNAGNPVIAAPPEAGGYPEFRDPFVWREGDRYYAIVGSGVKSVGGTALLYRSDDLFHWEFRKPLLIGDRETSGIFWEMPVFVPVGDKHVLIVCEVPGRASYWVGTWREETFTPTSIEPHRLELFNHMLSPTPHIASDGSVITMGIIPDQRSPKECWRAGWAHLYSLPRQLSLDAHGRLEQRPWEGLAKWTSNLVSHSNMRLPDGDLNTVNGASGKCLHIRTVLNREKSSAVEIILRRSPDDREKTVLRYEWEIGRLILGRTNSSLDAEVKRDLQETTYFPRTDGVLDLEIYLDVSVIEVFVDQRSAFATRIYPTLEQSLGLALKCVGGDAWVDSITIARVETVKP